MLVSAGLAGCSGGSADPGGSGPPVSPTPAVVSPTLATTSATPSATATASPSPVVDPNLEYGLPVPPRVRLTRLGTSLVLGEEAVVAWRPTAGAAAGRVGVLKIQVTRMRRGEIADLGAFELDAATRGSTPYYVDVIVTNVGRNDLGGTLPPLVLVDGTGTLVQPSTFQATFTPCAAQPLATPFPTGATGPACLVYLAPGKGTLAGIAFRPQASYAPITWTGTVMATG